MPNGKTTQPPQNAALVADRDYAHEIIKSMRETKVALTRTIWIVAIYGILIFMLLCYVLYHYVMYVVLQ